MKEMVGGCCVCSDERGWPENPLVYCDGQNCTVAVHQACYGIVTVPIGPWYCRKCESQERSARVRCELCPSRDGALKKTDNQGWAHVVCALYIPEVRFGNVTTMEPIILQLIPPERYSKTCYICQEIGKGNRANVGACMQCNKSGCKQQFHVTCAQALGLLCEEAGNYLDNVKYCGYCQHHYSKLKKGGNVKTIPPYKPITHETGSSDAASSPEKELEPNNTISTTPLANSIKLGSTQGLIIPTNTTSTSSSSKQRKSNNVSKSSPTLSATGPTSSIAGGSNNTNSINITSSSPGPVSSLTNSNKNSSNNTSSSKDKDKHSKNINKISSSSKNQERDNMSVSSTRDKSKSTKNSKELTDHSNSLAVNPNVISSNLNASGNAKESFGQKFTTSNFTESVVMNTGSVFGTNETSNTSTSSKSINSVSNSKKRKVDSQKVSNTGLVTVDTLDVKKDLIKDVSVTLVPLPIEKPDTIDIEKSNKKPRTDEKSVQQAQIDQKSTNPNFVSSHQSNQASNKHISSHQINTTAQIIPLNNNVSSHVKPLNIKDIGDENRLQSISTSLSSGIINSAGNSTPSLYVSVPLSTANVPGINLASVPSNVEHLNQPNRTSPIVNHHTHSHHHASNTLQSTTSLERQSPRQHVNSTQSSGSSTDLLSQSGSNVGHSHGLLANTHLSSVTDKGYEKQNLRITQLQEEQLPGRRSRSQSGENSGKSSRSSKKRSSAGSISAQTTTSVVTNSTTAALPVGSSTATDSKNITNVHPTKNQSHSKHDKGNSQNTNKEANDKTAHISNNSLKIGNNNKINSTFKKNESPQLATNNNSYSLNSTTKPLNKKLLRAQQTQYQNQQQTEQQLQYSSATTQTSIDDNPTNSTSSSNSRTPDIGSSNFPINNNNNSNTISSNSSNNGGLNFTYEPQISNHIQSATPPVDTNETIVKDSPPSSPGSESGSMKKRGRDLNDSKDIKLFQNGVATHMLGNQINPASSVAQKMTDQLNMEIEAHSIYIQPQIETAPQLLGVPFPGKQSNTRSSSQSSSTNSITSMLGSASNNANGNTPQSLEQLLERQWEQGSQFLMEQAQHFDIASLLSCLHQLRSENVRLEEHVNNLLARRDHLLAVNARLAIPLNPNIPQTQAPPNNMHMNGPTSDNAARISRTTSLFNAQQQIPVENGIDFRHTSFQSTTSNTAISRHATSNPNYSSTTSSNVSHLGSTSSSGRQSTPNLLDTSNIHTSETIARNRGHSNSGSCVGGGNERSYHSATQQSAYSNIHQSQLRRDDNHGKPS